MAVGTVGLGLVDCHCHLSAPDFNSVCEGDLGPAGVGRAASFPESYLSFPQILKPYLVCDDLTGFPLHLRCRPGCSFWS